MSVTDAPFLAMGDSVTNLGVALGIGSNRSSSAAGFVDKDGKFHARTCFVAGTLVTVVKREYRDTIASSIESIQPNIRIEDKIAIEGMKIGDYVLSWDENTKEKSDKKVTELFHHEVELLYNLKFAAGEIIQTTWNHTFYIVGEEAEKKSTALRGGWFEAKDLIVGDKLLNSVKIWFFEELEFVKKEYVELIYFF